jgi:hypothetical protein
VREGRWGNERFNRFAPGELPNLAGSRILVVVGSLSISGGTNLILQYAAALSKAGADVVVVYMLGSRADAAWHPQGSRLTFKKINDVRTDFFDLTILTWWRTVYEIPKFKSAKYLYFVQSLESRFALNHDDSMAESLAAGTYTLGIPMVTVAKWLQNLLMTTTQSPVWRVPNGIDKALFPVANIATIDKTPRPLRVLIEGQSGVPMKAVDESIQVGLETSEVEIWHAAPERGGGDPRADRVFESVPLNKMKDIYEQVDVLLKLSRVEGMFGPPLEAFHSGRTAVVSRVTGYDEYIMHDKNALAVEVDDFASARSCIEMLGEDRDLLERLSMGALETASKWPSVHETAGEFVHVCWLQLVSSYNSTNLLEQITNLKSVTERLYRNGEDPRSIFSPNLVSA